MHDIRFNEDEQYYEICVETGDETNWLPAASVYVRSRIPYDKLEELRDYTLYELLLMEGWYPPEL